MDLVKKFFVEEEGVNLTEYVILIVFIGLVAVIGVGLLGQQLNGWFGNVADRVNDWAQ